MSLLDNPEFIQAFNDLIIEGGPHIETILEILSVDAHLLDPLTRSVVFNMFGECLHQIRHRLGSGNSVREAHAQVIAGIMTDPVVDNLVQTQLKSMIDQSVSRFQEEQA